MKKIRWKKKAITAALECFDNGKSIAAGLDAAVKIQFPSGVFTPEDLKAVIEELGQQAATNYFYLSGEEADLLYSCLSHKYVGDFPGVGAILERIRLRRQIENRYGKKTTSKQLKTTKEKNV